MDRRLIYLPIEAYKSRSTEYMSTRGGVYESCFEDACIDFVVLRPWPGLNEIKQGIVVDYFTRARWGFEQVQQLLGMIAKGYVDPQRDVIFIEDFWTPGFEMIPYAQSLRFGYNVAGHAPVYSFCHAQSTDPYDFTAPMASWMRPMEQGWAEYQRGIVCASKEMIYQWSDGDMPFNKLHWCGLSYHAGVMQKMFEVPADVSQCKRDDLVVFSSRWDAEKNPAYFIELAKAYYHYRPEVTFCVCSGLNEITSNDPRLVTMLHEAAAVLPNLQIVTGLSKVEYFRLLRSAKVQFNCASQDFVSYTLLDAMVNGCAPLYPDALTFPDALNRSDKNLYNFGNQEDLSGTMAKLDALLDSDWEDYSWVWKKYEQSTMRKLQVMGMVAPNTVPSISQLCSMSVAEIKEYYR